MIEYCKNIVRTMYYQSFKIYDFVECTWILYVSQLSRDLCHSILCQPTFYPKCIPFKTLIKYSFTNMHTRICIPLAIIDNLLKTIYYKRHL